MRIGRMRLTHRYLMAKEKVPSCVVCSVRLTVKHTVSECMKYEKDRQGIKIEETLGVALGPKTADNMMKFIIFKNIELVQKNLRKKI